MLNKILAGKSKIKYTNPANGILDFLLKQKLLTFKHCIHFIYASHDYVQQLDPAGFAWYKTLPWHLAYLYCNPAR